MRLKDKVSIITGGASGIGRETALLFSKEGAKVVIADINEDGLKKVEEEIRHQGGEGFSFTIDVTKEEDWKNLMETVLNKFGRLDVLVNNAGVGTRGSIEETSFELWRKVMSINLDSVFLGTKYGIEAMKKTGGGSIINTSSVLGITSSGNMAAYSASKGGVRLLTKSAALHCAKSGIRVNSIHPGTIKTPLLELIPDVEKLTAQFPVGHLGDAIDIANGILFLASDESKFMTGAELIIDGGFTAQ
jgi:Dehydrogenases with different specificities (related to short-chain alcohol dehydrogenases)